MNADQIAGIAIITGAYGLMLYLLRKSNEIISEMKLRRQAERRRYAKKRIVHLLEVQRRAKHRRR